MKVYRKTSFAIAALVAVSVSGCDSSSAMPITLNGPQALAASDSPATGDTSVSDLLISFPERATADFASRFSGHEIEERFRKINYSAGNIVSEVYGLEGESSDTEVEAIYSAEGNFLSSTSSIEISEVGVEVESALAISYPGASFNEIEQIADDAGIITYQLEIENGDLETEVTLDNSGTVISTAEEVPMTMVPASVLSGVEVELQGYDEVEYEKVTANDGVIEYRVELETEYESVQYTLNVDGEITSITYEVETED